MKLFLDLDGVLVDFEKGVWHAGHPSETRQPGREEIEHFIGSLELKELWRTVGRHGDGFWTVLEWMPGGRELWDFVKDRHPSILTGTSLDPRCGPEKKVWCARELGEHINVITCFARDKQKWAGPDAVLVDDRTTNGAKWTDAGGIFVHHTDPAETIRQLKKLGF